MRIDRVAVQFYVRFRLLRARPCFLHTHRVRRLRQLRLPLGRPFVAVVADRANDLLARNLLQRILQVLHEPVLRRHRPRGTSGVVLVVIHQDHAIGVFRDILIIEVLILRRYAQVELLPAGMHVLVQLGGQRFIPWHRLHRKVFEVQRDAPEFVGRQERIDLFAELLPRRRIIQELPNILPIVLNRIEVVDQRKDLGIRFFCLQERH